MPYLTSHGFLILRVSLCSWAGSLLQSTMASGQRCFWAALAGTILMHHLHFPRTGCATWTQPSVCIFSHISFSSRVNRDPGEIQCRIPCACVCIYMHAYICVCVYVGEYHAIESQHNESPSTIKFSTQIPQNSAHFSGAKPMYLISPLLFWTFC